MKYTHLRIVQILLSGMYNHHHHHHHHHHICTWKTMDSGCEWSSSTFNRSSGSDIIEEFIDEKRPAPLPVVELLQVLRGGPREPVILQSSMCKRPDT